MVAANAPGVGLAPEPYVYGHARITDIVWDEIDFTGSLHIDPYDGSFDDVGPGLEVKGSGMWLEHEVWFTASVGSAAHEPTTLVLNETHLDIVHKDKASHFTIEAGGIHVVGRYDARYLSAARDQIFDAALTLYDMAMDSAALAYDRTVDAILRRYLPSLEPEESPRA